MRTQSILFCIFGFVPLLVAADSSTTSYVIETVAGSDFSAIGTSALSAIFSQAEGIAVDHNGAVYVADADGNRIRKINGGSIQTVAGVGVAGFSGDGGPASSALLSHPYGLAVDAQGDLFIADLGNARVRKVSPDGTIQTVAGGGTVVPGGNGDGGPATNAQLIEPRNVAVDLDGTLYISDFGAHQVFRVAPGGILTTLAGTGKAGFSGDNAAAPLAQLNSPAGLASDSNGSVYIADSGNNRIRRVYQGVITTVDNVTEPTGVALGPTGTLYIAASGYFGTQFKAVAGISFALDVAVDQAGNIYATEGQYIAEVASNGTVSIIAGSGAPPYFGGDNGPATAARLHSPSGAAIDHSGNFYIADTANNRIRMITSAGVITTIAGTGTAGSSGDNGLATIAQLNAPRSVAVDSQYNIYVADTGNNSIRKIAPGGIITTIAGLHLSDPEYVAVDSNGSLYIADAGNGRVLKLATLGGISMVMQTQQPSSITVDPSGNIYVTDATRISEISASGSLTTVLSGLHSPRGLAITESGDLIVAETGVNVVRKLSANGTISTIAGTGIAGFSGDGQTASTAQLNAPADLLIDPNGTIWIADSANNRIRTLTASAIAADVQASATMVNAATLSPGPIAPGEIITIFGAGFDPKQTQVLFGSESATIFYTGTSQINALAPSDLLAGSITDVNIVVDGTKIAGISSQVINAAPGLFTTAGNGTGQAAAINEDGTVNSASNPAARGSIISLYATGQGAGAGTPGVKIGLYAAQLLYAGAAPGFPGLMQINAQIPAGFLAPGIQPIVLTVGGIASQSGVTIAIR
jgi:uncharacterized protein (TIGR03437 family)